MRTVLYLLASLSDEDVEWLMAAGKRNRLARGSTLALSGDQIDVMTIVLDGSISVSIDGTGEIARLASGDLLGGKHSPSAVATAIEPALVLSFDRPTFNDRLENDPAFAGRLKTAIDMLRSAQRPANPHHRRDGSSISQRELDPEVMENLTLAAARFDRMVKKLTNGRQD